MSVAVITGSAGLVGSESVRYFARRGMRVVGVDNDMRAEFFGSDASTTPNLVSLQRAIADYEHHSLDIRDEDGIGRLFQRFGGDISLVIHAAAQPSHDWAAKAPVVDFTVNANGTLNLLEATRKHAPNAVFIFTSTNKVYGDTPNTLPLVERDTRWELEASHPWASRGIPEEMSLDQTLHSLFGASKVAADVLVQEYGRYFGMRTGVFRGGCLTGPNHAGTQLHGFLSYLMKCTLTGTPYTIFGHKGKQVRDNIHSEDLVHAFDAFFGAPQAGEVFNIGGGVYSNCSMLEAIQMCEEIAGRKLDWQYRGEERIGDHRWYVSDLSRFQSRYPEWKIRHGIWEILSEIADAGRERWLK